jgi:hypothetical protein
VKGLVPFAQSDTRTTDEKRVAAKGTHQRGRRLRRSMLGSTSHGWPAKPEDVGRGVHAMLTALSDRAVLSQIVAGPLGAWQDPTR